MSNRFHCLNEECRSGYCLEVAEEILADEANMATLFCPHCKATLTRAGIPSAGCAKATANGA